uniref:Uncharacterized protein n=1 Tax=Chromera velia CCMP2878 TaxID=1169474 RepID=A0A0G4FJ71_9ALVE|eukprot:Cvel_17327.t1-p1 / transcript=Cvel_17327.t1 / gene=Cvel_17327 / organism=Chromera_velia_CCMP2878 / gene_product=hypothetical protein / transcript_product=hypothetical protein / location=Cvel_scaffold1376:30416-31430(+) / protein_length=260 / sequence_SO=supercontig / SO=protein_coding / is_pseudo=false
MDLLWRDVTLEITHSTHGHFFDAYVRQLMLQEGGSTFLSRKAVGAGGDRAKRELELPHYNSLRFVTDVPAAVKACRTGNVVYHSVDQSFPLVDFMFKHGGMLYVVNATVAAEHDAKPNAIEQFVKSLDLKARRFVKLKLLFAVPMKRFKNFVTKPVEPSTTQCEVHIIGVVNPKEERGVKRSLPESDTSPAMNKRLRSKGSESGPAASGNSSSSRVGGAAGLQAQKRGAEGGSKEGRKGGKKPKEKPADSKASNKQVLLQ